MKIATAFDVGRIDQSLAKGLLKRMLREGNANCQEVLATEYSRQRTLRRGPTYRKNLNVAKKALGNFVTDVIPLPKRRTKEEGTVVIGLDTSTTVEHSMPVVVLLVAYKAAKIIAKFPPAEISHHAIERVLERHQLRDMAMLRPYLSRMVWATYCTHAATESPGVYWFFLDLGMCVVHRAEDGLCTAKTWVPQEMWSVAQRRFFDHYTTTNDRQTVLTNSNYHDVSPRHTVTNPYISGGWFASHYPVYVISQELT